LPQALRPMMDPASRTKAYFFIVDCIVIGCKSTACGGSVEAGLEREKKFSKKVLDV